MESVIHGRRIEREVQALVSPANATKGIDVYQKGIYGAIAKENIAKGGMITPLHIIMKAGGMTIILSITSTSKSTTDTPLLELDTDPLQAATHLHQDTTTEEEPISQGRISEGMSMAQTSLDHTKEARLL